MAFFVSIASAQAPAPDDTLHVAGHVPYLGAVATGRAYVRLAPGHAAIANPVVVVEGFDLDDSMDWDPLYELLNRENLIERLRDQGFDAVVLDFDAATDYLQRNAFVFASLLDTLNAMGTPGDVAVVGASMGGLLARYALAWKEANGEPHRVRLLLTLDAPHRGANIPLGIQYWVSFFSGMSAEAAFLLSRLDSPAARQMLLYHHTDPPQSAPTPDPLFTAFASELDSLGGWPAQPRTVAVANGSGAAQGQGFVPGAQIIEYDYNVLIAQIRGDVWAVPAGTNATIFDGRIYILFSTNESQVVTVSGTQPFDNAPGGFRATMTQMDTVPAPYGDIIALHPAHAFVPTVSALDLDVPDLFHDLFADPALMSHTPLDTVYFPAANQEHVAVTAENADWIEHEIVQGVLAVGPPADAALEFSAPWPQPSRDVVRLRFRLPAEGRVQLTIYDVSGRQVAHPLDRDMAAGTHLVTWDGRGIRGALPAGLYFARLDTSAGSVTQRLIRVR